MNHYWQQTLKLCHLSIWALLKIRRQKDGLVFSAKNEEIQPTVCPCFIEWIFMHNFFSSLAAPDVQFSVPGYLLKIYLQSLQGDVELGCKKIVLNNLFFVVLIYLKCLISSVGARQGILSLHLKFL